MESTSDQVNNECVETVVAETVPEPTTNSTTTTTTTTTITNSNEIENDVKMMSKEIPNEPERTQQELAAMLRILIANFCDEHFVKKVKKAKLLMDNNKSLEKINEQKNENVVNTENTEKDQIDEMDTVNLTLSPPSSSVSNYSQTKTNENETKIESENPSNQSQEPSKLISSLLVGLDKLEIFGSIHVRSNNVRLLSCLIDEQLTFNNSDVSFSSASSSISSSGRYKFHLHRHSHGHRRHRGRHGYKKFREIKKIQAKKSTNHHQEINSYPIKKFKVYHDYKENKKNEELNSVQQQKSVEDGDEDDDHNKTDNNLENLASVAAQAVKLNTEKTNSRKPRKSPNVVPIHDDSELEYMNDDDMENGENFNEENVVNDALYAEEDNSSIISESFSDSSLLRHRRHRSNSSLYSEPSSIISSHKNNRLSRSPSLGASSSYGYENEYRSYSSCSSLSDYDAYDNYDSKKSHKRKDKNDRHKSDRKRMSKEQENMINSEDIKIEKEVEKEIEQPLQEPEVNPIEERRREEEYLMRKYKRRFSSFKNSDTQDQNLYLLESSRQHHRVYDVADMNQNPEQQVFMQKMMNVNSLVDRLSPISDPDMEHNLKNKTQNFTNQEQAVSGPSQKSEILNRINNLSPSSSSSSSSSIKNQNSLAAFHSLHNSQQNNAAAVLAAAAAAAAAAADLRNIHPHAHLNHNTQLHNHHAQSVAQLLADMQHQQQTHSQSEAAKVIAATLSNHHQHHPHLNPHHLLNRFSNNNQNDLMAAVLAQQQQQQQQQHQHQQHRSLLDTHTHLNSHQSYSTNGQLNQNGPIYNRYSSHLNAAIAAASAAAANLNSHQRRANSVESDATPSPPSTTPAVNGMSNNTQSISSAASSTSSTSENYKYKEEPKVSKEKSDNGNGNEKVRLVAGYDVFISTNDLNACNDDRGSATRLLRNLMDVFFDKSTLAKSSINGTGRITNTLDKHVISALFAYVKNRYPDVPHSQLTRAATDKCVQTRRNFRKKIKAAQSYFGMFPSLMMTRPPQLPQASENPV